MVLIIYIFLAFVFVQVTTTTTSVRMSCKISQNRRHDKYGVGRVGIIISLAPISLVKLRLPFGGFALPYNPKFHCVKSPPTVLILRPALIAKARGHYSNLLSSKLLAEHS